MRPVQAIEARLSGKAADAYRRCLGHEQRAIYSLAQEVDQYLESLRFRSEELEFLDLITAERVALHCHAILGVLASEPTGPRHEAAQAAILYFALDDDGEPDSSVVGFDDDLAVVLATAEVLGIDLSERRA
jgi:hypothetical protein